MEKKKQQQNKSPKTRKQEKLTREDLESLMGMYRDVYVKRNGAWRRK